MNADSNDSDDNVKDETYNKRSKRKKNSIKEIKEKTNRKRCPFSENEDKKLLDLVQKYDPNEMSNWKYIAMQFTDRNARQCRERYNLFLKKGNRIKEKWTLEEDNLLISKFQIHGPHWKILEKYFSGRNSYNIKNRYNSIKHKIEMNKAHPDLINANDNNNNTITSNIRKKNKDELAKNESNRIDSILFKNDDDFDFQIDFNDFNKFSFQYF